MKAAISATPLPARMLAKTKGRSPRILLGVAVHDFQAGADIRGEVDLVDDQQVAARDAGAALAGDLVAGRNVDDVDRQVRQFGAEGGRQVVAAGFDQDQVEIGKALAQVGDAGEVDRGVLADRGVRAAAGFDAQDAFGRQRAGARQELGVFLGVDVVGDGGDVVGARGSVCRARPSARSCRCRRGRRHRRAEGRGAIWS